MLLEKMADFCNAEYNKTSCSSCTYKPYCPNNECARCLHYIHTPSSAPAKRNYDCERMAFYYVCKYSYKYASELIYALTQLRDIKVKETIKVMSMGCGPCTDLFALDYLRNEGDYSFKTLEYRGVDLNHVWENIHKRIKSECAEDFKVKFFYKDIFELMSHTGEKKWLPDLIIFQYVFSDMQKNSDPAEIKHFIGQFASFINKEIPINSYIVMNDINLWTNQGGGRDYFNILMGNLIDCIDHNYHFKNSNKPNHYDYGEEYTSNKLKFTIPQTLGQYEPFDSCSSAQKLIKKAE